jgi:hypothetical protein
MKRIVSIILFLASLFTLSAKNKALLVGVSNYPKESGWCTLSSVRDVEQLGHAISPSFELTTLIDDQATYHGIISALEEMSSKAQKGDTIFIHFSCHGQQMLTHDCGEVDYLDEALIPFDAFSQETAFYKGECHLKDDVLSQYIQGIRYQVGSKGLVVVTLDSCHSDSMDKGSEEDKTSIIYRGGLSLFGGNHLTIDSLVAIKERWRTKQVSDLYNNTLAHVLYLSACNSYEKNREILVDSVWYGSLSHAVISAFQDFDFSDISQWRKAILENMKKSVPFQTPQTRSSLDFQDHELIPIEIAKVDSVPFEMKNILLTLSVIILLFLFIWRIMKLKK